MISPRTDRTYLTEHQYRTGSNLDARIELHRRFSTSHVGWHRWLFDRMHLPDRARILELGCGTCAIWVQNGDRIPPGWDITLTDLSSGMLDEGRLNLQGIDGRFTFREADAQHIPFQDGQCDAVIANHMLYHVPDIASALKEIRRVLHPDGRLFASTLGRESMPELSDALRAINPSVTFGQTISFTLEDGAEQLSREFGYVRLELFDDALEVTELEPLIAYTASTSSWEQLNEEQRERFEAWAQYELEAHGCIYISKSQGVFTAW